jgi:uncharacterized membrane protein YkgB
MTPGEPLGSCSRFLRRILGALGGGASFIATSTIIPFFPHGWEASAGGFPAVTEHVAFLMKDLVLLAVSFYLLKQDVVRASLANELALSGDTAALRVATSAH